MRIVLFGPPGSGKGTYATILKNRLGIPHISTGDLVREEIRHKTSIGAEIEKYSNSGKLVSDDIITKLLQKRVDTLSGGFILEGFPRSIEQAKQLEKITKIDVVIDLEVPDHVIVGRLSARIQCKNCGTIYNERTMRPKVVGKCDKCSGELFKRIDDRPEVILERLRIYKETSAPVVGYYRKKGVLKEFKNDDPDSSPETVVNRLMSLL
jgi:adenylate kinase